jgi:hypothetical protein
VLKYLKRVHPLRIVSSILYTLFGILLLRWAIIDSFSPEPLSALPQWVLGVIGFIADRKAREINYELFKEFQRQLSKSEEEVRRLSPKTALRQVLSLKESVQDSTLPKKLKKSLYAEIYYLIARCNADLGTNQDVYSNFILAHSFKKDDIKLLERACTSNYLIGRKDEAAKQSRKILKDRPNNPRAWAIKVADVIDLDFQNLPVSIRSSLSFKNILIAIYNKQNRVSEVRRIFDNVIIKDDLPEKIDHDNHSYWLFVCSHLYNIELKEFPNDAFSFKDELVGKSERIKKVAALANLILQFSEGSELVRESKVHKQVPFICNHCLYLIDDNRQAVAKMYDQFKREFNAEDNFGLLVHLLTSLSQINEYEKVVELCQSHPHSKFTYTHILAYTYLAWEKFDKASEYFSQLVDETNEIDHRSLSNLIISVAVLKRFAGVNVRLLFDKKLVNKHYLQTEYAKIIKAICYHFYVAEENRHEIVELLNFEANVFDSFPNELKDQVCKTLTYIGEFEKSNQYVVRYVNKVEESQGLYLYIRNLYNSKSDHKELLELLERWRKNFKPLYEFFACELNILNQLHIYPRIEEVAEHALLLYPEQPDLSYFLITALNRQDDKCQKLQNCLTNDLLNIKFTWQQAFHIATVCFRHEREMLGFELMYPYAKGQPNNATIRQSYFGITVMHGKQVTSPRTVEVETTVRINYGGSQKLIIINDAIIENNKLAKALLGKCKGDVIKYRETSLGKEIEVTITDIYNKYNGLAAEIADEVAFSNKIIGYEMKSISWTDISDMTKKLVEEFGADGELRRLTFEDAFKSFHNGTLSFTELIRRVDDHKIFEVYDSLTNGNSNGFRVLPISFFKKSDFSEITEFVVDFTTLPMLSQWNDLPVERSFSFIVSQHLRDFLKDKITEVSLLDDSPLTLSITLSGVQPIPYAPNYKSNFKNQLQQMLIWLDKNCKVTFAPEKLDLLLKHPELIERNDWYFTYVVDTVYLANSPGRALLTDDLFMYKSFSHLAKPITLEYFIKTKVPGNSSGFVKRMLMANYVGLTLDNKLLSASFDESPILNAPNAFQKCLKNLPFNLHLNEEIIFEVIVFAKYIYSHDLDDEYKLRIIESLFVQVLQGYPVTPSLGKVIQQKIIEAFHLLGDAEKHVTLRFISALRIIAQK